MIVETRPLKCAEICKITSIPVLGGRLGKDGLMEFELNLLSSALCHCAKTGSNLAEKKMWLLQKGP